MPNIVLVWLLLLSLGFGSGTAILSGDVAPEKIEIVDFTENADSNEVDEKEVDWISDLPNRPAISSSSNTYRWTFAYFVYDIILEQIPAPPPEQGLLV